MPGVRLTVHRSTREIGGNCVEIGTEDGHRVIIDVGRPLDAPQDTRGLLAESLDTGMPADGVLVSHPHQDHYGLLNEIPSSWPIYAGEGTGRLLKLSAAMFGKAAPAPIRYWKSGVPFALGPFAVTPFLIDHSAFDAYMLLIDVHGRRVLYSGDFRLHGRKGALTRRLMAAPPANVDVLLMEGTNLGSAKPWGSERSLEVAFARVFERTKGRVFVAWSAQNIDRTVTLYRACLKSGRTLAVDLYTAEVMETLADLGRLPRPGWRNLNVVITPRLKRMYRRTGREAFTERMAQSHGIGAAKLAACASNWVVMTRASLIGDYARKGVLPDGSDVWCWSMWSGYLKTDEGIAVRGWFEEAGTPHEHLHTSGHASPADLQAFATAMAPNRLIPIHGTAWDRDTSGFPPILRLADGETITI